MQGSEREEADDLGLGDVLDFMRVLWAVDHGLEASSKQMDAQLGVTGPQRLVIRVVGRRPGISAGQLAEIMHVHPSTLTGILGRLVDRGIVTRRADPADGRRALLGLTAHGRKLDEVKTGTVEAKVRKALLKLAPKDVATARKVLHALADSLAPAPDTASASAASRERSDRTPQGATPPRRKRGDPRP